MFRKMLPLAVAIVFVLGCGKKKDEGGGGGGDTGGSGGDPNAAYTLKVREEQKGDKVQIVRTEDGTTSASAPGKNKSEKMASKFDYVEEVVEMAAGAAKPTKLTRTYKAAERSEGGGPVKPMSIVGKTVVIEKKGATYTATVNGKPLGGEEANEVLGSLNKPDGPTTADMLPKNPVKLNEGWTVEESAIKKLAASSGMPIDPAKSSMTGKLTKVYTKDGKQWGVIEWHFEVSGKTQQGELKVVGDMTADAPIDGSAYAGTRKTKGKVTVTAVNGVTVVIEATEVETITPVK